MFWDFIKVSSRMKKIPSQMRKAVDQGGGYDFRVNILIFSLEMGGDCWSYKIFKITFFLSLEVRKIGLLETF